MGRVYLHIYVVLFLCAFTSKSIAQCDLGISVPEDITICSPENIDLVGSVSLPYLSVEWTGSNGFTDEQLVTSNTPASTTTYTLSAFASTGINLVQNGDFEQGNTAFSSSYLNGEVFCPVGPFNPWGSLGCEGMYVVTNDPSSTHTNFQPCNDHTTGAGQMMVVNGSIAAINIWCQDVAITADTDYLFSAWATSVNSSSPAVLQFSINGNLIGSNFGLNGTTCLWENFNNQWNSGSNTTATICITNQNTSLSGNDFAIDDIVFEEVCRDEMSFDVTIAEVLGTLPTSNSLDCDNDMINLDIQPAGASYTYSWNAQFGGLISGPLDQSSAIALTSGLYEVTISDENGCTKKLTTSVQGSTQPPTSAILGDFQLTCENNEVNIISTNTASANTYFWFGSIDNPNEPIATYNTAGSYFLEITNQFNCSSIFPFEITDNVITPNYDIELPDILNCIGDTTDININFDQEPDEVVWYDPEGNIITNESSFQVADIGYYVVNFEYGNGCNFSDSVLVTSEVSELEYTLGESPVINCIDSLQILEVDIEDDVSSIVWKMGSLVLSGAMIEVSTPGLYVVDIIDNQGCITRDSVEVLSDFLTADFEIFADEIDCVDGEGELSIDVDSFVVVNWILPDGSTEEGEMITSNIEGNHIAIVTNQNGCTSVDTIELIANQNFPVIDVDFESINCASPNTTVLISSSINGTNYDWQGPNGFTSSNSELLISETGAYLYTATTVEGCSISDTILITGDFEEPDLILASDTLTCVKGEATITLSSSVDVIVNNVVTSGNFDVINGQVIVNSDGITSITVQSENGCETTSDVEVPSNYNTPTPIIIENISLDCSNPDSLLTLPLEADVDIFWIIDNDTVGFTNELLLDSDHNYSLVFTSQESGCSSTSAFSTTTDFEANPFTFNANDIDCNNLVSLISLNTSQEISSIEYDQDIIEQSSQTFTTEIAGTYNFVVTYSNGCSSMESVTISVDTISPSLNIDDAELPCTNDPLQLFNGTIGTDLVFNWTGPNGFSSNAFEPIVSSAGLYEITASNTTNGCFSSQIISISESQTMIEFDLGIEQPLCPEDQGFAIIENITGGRAPYTSTFTDESGNIVAESDFTAGSYFAEIIDDDGCETMEFFTIDDISDFSVDAGETKTISIGDNPTLEGTTSLAEPEITSINWSPAEFLSCTDCLEPEISNLLQDQWFYLKLINQNGCLQTDSVFVRVVINYNIYEPNIFSPDDNGINDVFFLQSNTFASTSILEEFAIYDRWGNLVFKVENGVLNDPSYGWDGKHNNINVMQGTYAYYAKILLPDGSMEKLIGSVTIVR